jgi:hypothetical protein
MSCVNFDIHRHVAVADTFNPLLESFAISIHSQQREREKKIVIKTATCRAESPVSTVQVASRLLDQIKSFLAGVTGVSRSGSCDELKNDEQNCGYCDGINFAVDRRLLDCCCNQRG